MNIADTLLRQLTFRHTAAAALALTAAVAVGCEDEGVEDVDLDTSASLFSSNDRFISTAVQDTASTSMEGQFLSIQKQYPEQVVAGKQIEYTIQIANTSDQPLQGVMIKEQLPEGFEVKSSEPQFDSNEDGTLKFSLGEMEAGALTAITVTGTPHNVGESHACTSFDFERGVCAPLTVVNPNLKLTRNIEAEQVSICEPVTINYTLTNSGDTAAENVRLYEELPQGLMLAEGEEISFNVESLESGESVEHQVQVFPEQAGEYSSYAFAESELDQVESQSDSFTVVAPKIDVQVRTARDYAYIGDAAAFEVIVTNNGEGAATGVVADIASEGIGEIAYVGNRGDVQLASAEYQDGVGLGSLEPGQSRNFFVEVDTEQEGEVTLQAEAMAVCARTERTLAQAETSSRIAILPVSALQVEVVDSQDPVQVGEATIYEITVINEGSGEDTNLQVSAELPKGFSFVQAEGVSEVTQDGSTLKFATIETLPAGSTASWYVRAQADETAGNGRMNVEVKSDLVSDGVTSEEPTRAY